MNYLTTKTNPNFETLKAKLPEARISPAFSLDLETGIFDEDGWAELQSLTVGDTVELIDETGRLSGKCGTIEGFTLDNEVLVKPLGDWAGKWVDSLFIRPKGLRASY